MRMQVEAKHSHPARAIALFKMAAVRERRVAIKNANVIKPEEPALENIVAFGILAIHPPGKSDEQFVEDSLQKSAIAFAGLLLVRSCKPARQPSRSPAD